MENLEINFLTDSLGITLIFSLFYLLFWNFIRYVEQSNILMPLATVRETIAFAAETRLSKKTKEQKINKVDSIIGKHLFIIFNYTHFTKG